MIIRVYRMALKNDPIKTLMHGQIVCQSATVPTLSL